MAQGDVAQVGLSQAVARFPGKAAIRRRLALSDREFRGRSEEYALAQESHARFEALPASARRPEIGDCRSIIAELENETGRFVTEADPGS